MKATNRSTNIDDIEAFTDEQIGVSVCDNQDYTLSSSARVLLEQRSRQAAKAREKLGSNAPKQSSNKRYLFDLL